METNDNKHGGYLRQGWLVLVLAFVYGGALAGVQTTLAPRIRENKRQETYRVIPMLVDGADQEQTEELVVTPDGGKDHRVYRTCDSAGVHNGWVLPAAGQGFADKIELLIGLDQSLSTITGVYVLSQKETPGLGDYIRDPVFLERFRYKQTDVPLSVVKDGADLPHEIDAWTGATVSSWAVCDTVNAAVKDLRQPILRDTGNTTEVSAQE